MKTILLGNNETEVNYKNMNELIEIAKGFNITIGNNVSVGYCVSIEKGVTILDNASIENYVYIKKNATIGKRAKVCEFSVIMQNINICNGACVGMGEVIEDDFITFSCKVKNFIRDTYKGEHIKKTLDRIWDYIEDKIAKISYILWDR